MAKKGMKRPDWTDGRPRDQLGPVPELQGKAKHTKEKAGPIIYGSAASGRTDHHRDRPIPSDVYPAIDNDLARDNLENDITAADREDL